MQKSREILRDIGTTWIQAFPNSAAALQTYALAMERTGDLESRPPSTTAVPTALEAAHQLRSIAATTGERVVGRRP